MTEMGMVQFRPFLRDVHTLAGQLPQPYRTLDTRRPGLGTAWLPAVDVYHDGSAIRLEAELPGMSREDIDIRVEHGALVLSGERKPATHQDVDAPKPLRAERVYGRFERTFPLPPGMVEAQNIEASYRDGILRVMLPKTESSRPRKIDVNVH